MKKLTILGMMALLCAVACQREPQAVVPDNPTYNPDTKEVTAKFVLSISTNRDNSQTRMTAADAQVDGSFRGMEEVHLLTYSLNYPEDADTEDDVRPNYFIYNVSNASSLATRDYNLGTALVSTDISETQSSKVLEISLPLETNAILLYGRSPRTKSKDAQGSVIASIKGGSSIVGAQVDNIRFTLENRLANKDAFYQFTSLISRILTGILKAGRSHEYPAQGYLNERDYTYRIYDPITPESRRWLEEEDWYEDGVEIADGNTKHHPGYTYHHGSKLWRDYGIAYAQNTDEDTENNVELRPMEELLGEMYQNITTLRTAGEGNDMTTELRAGSSQAVLRLSKDVFNQLMQVIGGNVTSWQDSVAVMVANEIRERASQFFILQDQNRPESMVWRDFNYIMQMAAQHLPPSPVGTNATNLITADFFNDEANNKPGFPLNLGLPAGAAIMRFDTRDIGGASFEIVSYEKKIPAYGMGGEALPIENYRYPAELMYWTNSSIRTSDTSFVSANYPKTVTDWDVNTWNHWNSNGSVKSTTRSVAVTKQVNYGSALLETHVKYGSSIIHDNNSGIHKKEKDNMIDVEENANQFQVVGILIGGVTDEVSWNFLPADEGTTNTVVYDRLAAGQRFNIPQAGATSGPIYTMTWDNYDKSQPADGQNHVFIALELINNTGKDLWGGLNIIRSGGTFYLVGELDPTNSNALARLKKNGVIDLSRKNFNYPPYDVNGNTINAVRVFMQDYVTEVTFTFNKHSLRNAYVTMPDLRASNVSLGLSVDLEWKKGLQFTDVPLGGNESDEEFSN